MGYFLDFFKIFMSILVMNSGILEWIDFESEVSSVEIHHGITAIGFVMFMDAADKIYQSLKTIKDQKK